MTRSSKSLNEPDKQLASTSTETALRATPSCLSLTVCEAWIGTTLVTLICAHVATFVWPSDEAWRAFTTWGWIEQLTNYDGIQYSRIVEYGYSYQPGGASQSTVVFFPAFPTLGWLLSKVTGLPANLSLVVVANLCLLGAFAVFAYDLGNRPSDQGNCITNRGVWWFAFWPLGVFYHAAYTESLFVLLECVFLLGIRLRWPWLALAVIAGAASATRSVGVALGVVLIAELWKESTSVPRFCKNATWLAPLSCWGLIAFTIHQYFTFGDAIAFVHSQQDWLKRPTALLDKLVPLMTVEPVWSAYLPGSSGHWSLARPNTPWYQSLDVVNPLFFVAASILVSTGTRHHWISRAEAWTSWLLLLVPYVTVGYDNLMQSQRLFSNSTSSWIHGKARLLPSCFLRVFST